MQGKGVELLTDDDNSVVVAADGDVGLALRAEAGDVSALRADDAREHGAVGQREETDVGHLLGVLDRVARELERLVERTRHLGDGACRGSGSQGPIVEWIKLDGTDR